MLEMPTRFNDTRVISTFAFYILPLILHSSKHWGTTWNYQIRNTLCDNMPLLGFQNGPRGGPKKAPWAYKTMKMLMIDGGGGDR